MSIKTLTIAVFLTVIILFSNTLVAQEKTKKKTKNLKIGLTLSGGAASGLAHIGVLQAIDDAELNIDYISGTSMGAIIGALYAIGYSGKDIEKIVTSTDFIEIFQDKPPFSTIPMEGRKEFNNYMLEIPIKNLRNIIPTGLIEGQTFWLKLSSLFAPVYNVDDFSKFSIPFKAIAADLEKGEVLVLDKGNIANALRASAAIPYIFTPIEINGIQMIDGGIVRNFPVINTIESGATYNIGVNVGINDSKIKLNSAIEILSHLSRYQNMFDLPKEIDASDIYIYLGPYDDIGSSLSFSKSGVKKILDKGKKMTEVYYHTFKALADSLKKDDPNYKFKRNRLPKTDDTIIIKKIAVSNLEKSSQENFIKTLGISLNKGYTIDQINSYIKKLLGKHFYKNIRYNFEKDDQGDYTTINFYAQEVDKNYFKAGLFFNNTSKTTLKLNVTSRDLLTRESTFIFTAYIGRYPTFSINNVFYNNPYDNIRLVTLGSLYKRSIIPPTIINNFRNNLYNQILDLNINEDYTSINGNIYYEPIQDLSFNIFSAFSFTNHSFNIYNNIETTDTKVNSKSMFFTIGPSLEIDTRDKKFFPSKGVFWNVNAFYIKPIKHSYLDKTYGHNSDIYNELKSTFLNSYGSIQMYSDLNWYLPMTNFLVLNLGTQLGLNFNFRSNDYPINLNQSFLIGGINQNINRNQITFIGLSDAGFIANNAAVGMVNLQIRPIKNFYVSIKGNYLGYYNGGSIFTGMEPKLKKMYGSILGAGVSLTYTSPIGPLQFTMMQSPKYNNTLLYVNLGLAF